MSVKNQKPKMSEAIDEQTLKLIAKYSSEYEYDLMDYIEAQLTPSSPSDLFTEQFLFIKQVFQIIRNYFFKTGVVTKPIAEYPKISKSWYSEYYFSDLQQILCKDGWLCNLLGEDINKNNPEHIVKIMEVIGEATDNTRWHYRVSPFPVAVLITKLGAKEFCGCSEQSTMSPEKK